MPNYIDKTSEKIHQATLKFLMPLNLSETCTLIVSEGLKLVKGEYGSVLLEQQGSLQRVYASNPDLYEIKIRKNDFMYSVLKNKQPIILNRGEIGKLHPEILKTEVQSDIIAPLFYRNKPIGILSLMSSKKQAFADKELSIIKLFTPMASLSLRKAQLHNETQKAIEAQDLFISMAAHEMRTPLTTINGYIQLIHSKFSGANTPESRWVEELSRESLRLVNLVNEFLQVERIRTGKMQYSWQECRLVEIINRAILNLHFTYPDFKIILHNKLDGQSDLIVGDCDKLTQVIINLLDNAVKFSTPDKPIAIYLQRNTSTFIIKIKDQGKGITKKDMPRIFNRFARGSNPQQREGMGLGLFLAKNIIEQHRGKIRILSKENKGTMVEVKLPALKK